MKHTLTSKAAELMRKNGRHRRWRRAFSGMAAVVVFITTYMLILPAITMENQAICGMAEHTHTDACYEMQLVCTQEETPEGADVHVHGPECYEQQQVLTCTKQEGEGHTHTDACYGYVCGQEESAGHTHTDACYTEVTHRELTCTEPESAGHTHGDGCYDEEGSLVCTESESTGHTHSDSCYTETVTRELTCGQEESSGHTHTDACIGLICGKEESAGHTHTDACYTTEDVLVCTEPTGHTHGDGCYEKVLVCDVPEHTHTEECYPAEQPEEPQEPQEPELICTLPEHSHEDACYDADGNLICGLEEHTHTEDCYAPVEIPEEETPTTAFPEEIPEGYKDYTFENKEEGLSILVYAPENAFGDQKVDLFAEVLPEDSEEYAQAKENLDKAENAPEYTGMAAMDIRFVDAAAEDPAQAEEIEPDASMGQVFVKIDAKALLPEDVDESTLAVQHHVETESDKIFGVIPDFIHPETVTVETVADSSEETGDITATPDETALPETLPALADAPEMAEAATLEEPTAEPEEPQPVAMNVEAEFAVNSFSTFTITWQHGLGLTGTLTFHYWDVTTNSEFDGPRSGNQNAWNSYEYGKAVKLSDYADEIEGYTYQGEARANSAHGTVITHVKFNRTGDFLDRKYQWQYSDNGGSSFKDWGSEGSEGRDVYLIYASDEVVAPPISTTVTTGKTVTLQNGEQPGGLYDLTLSITGDRGSQSSKQKVDVLFILDESNSMANEWEKTTRIKAAKNAISQIMGYGQNVGLSDNENLDVRYALVGFGGGDSGRSDPYIDAGIEANWTGDTTTVYSAIPTIKSSSNRYGGGTNYEAGFRTGKEVLEDGRDDALTVVIFISDGNPGYYYNSNGATQGTGNPGSYYDEDALSHAVSQCGGLDTDYFYFVGVTNSVSSKVFTDIVNAVPVAKSNKDSISANDPDELLAAFDDIQQQITFFACSDVTITDPLSEYAELAENARYTVKVTKTVENVTTTVVEGTVDSGQGVTFNSEEKPVTVTPTYNDQTRTITLDFTDQYELEEGYIYSVTTTIQPTEAATEAGTAGYNGRGDAGTGTHAGQPGFYSNDNEKAVVTFKPTVNSQPGEETKELFPKPVIQVFDPGDIQMKEPTITKEANLRDDGDYDLTLTVSGSTGTATKKAEVDVLMIVDVSNSMTNNGSPRLNNAKAAMKKLVETLESKDTVDARYSIVKFSSQYDSFSEENGGEKDASLVLDWNGEKNTVDTSITGLNSSGGTNYQAGLRLGAKQLQSARSTATTVVIFLSDGTPTYYIGGGNGSNTVNGDGWTATVNEAKTITCSQFYSVSIGNEQVEKMTEISNAVNAPVHDSIAVQSDASDLTNKFEEIAGSVTYLSCENVTISDTLSDYAEAVMGTNGVPEELTVKVTDANGNDVTETEVTADNIIASYDAETKLLKLDFNDSYQLKQDYTYSVTLKIKPTKAAEDEYKELSGVYPDTPDKGTGTHADRNEKGFFSNADATLTYKITGDNRTYELKYDDPVIQLSAGSLSITKMVDRTDGGQVDPNSTFDFTVTVEGLTGSYDATYSNSVNAEKVHSGQVTFTNGTANVTLYHGETVVIEGLPGGKSATITEITTDGYSTNWRGDIASGTEVSPGATVTTSAFLNKPEVTCTNTTGAVLPSTGGMGTTPFLALGTLLTLGAGMLLVQRRRKEGSDAV